MATALNNEDQGQTALAMLSGQSGSTNTSTSSGSGSSATGSTATNTAGTGSTPNASTQQIANLNSGADFSPLLNYVQGYGTQAKNAINAANTSFNTSLGSFTPFGTDAQNTLQQVINGKSPLSDGTNLLNTSYTGPSSFDSSSYNPLLTNYGQYANDLSSQGGIASLFSQMNPALTPGEANYDALSIYQNPGFQSQAKAIQNDANTTNTLGTTTATNAQNAISQRQSDIQNFDTQAQGYVQQQQDSLKNLLNTNLTSAQNQGQTLQNDIAALQNGSMNVNQIPTNEMSFNPSQYAPQEIKSQYGSNVFDQTVNPWQFLTYNAGTTPTLGSVATPDQITQWNNEEALLNGYNTLQPGTNQSPTLGFDNTSWQSALAAANASMNQADANYAKAHPPLPPYYTVNQGTLGPDYGSIQNAQFNTMVPAAGWQAVADPYAYVGQNAYTLIPTTDASGNPINPDQPASTLSQQVPDFGVYVSTGGPGGTYYNDTSPQAFPNPNAGHLTGGLIHEHGRRADTQIAPEPRKPSGGVDAVARLLADHRTPMPMQHGGAVPNQHNKIPDTIPARVNDGEFVVRNTSVNALGKNNLTGLNNIDRAPVGQQDEVRNALHTALSRALGKGFADGGLTTAGRDRMPQSEFAGPDRSFPVNDKKHARLAISGATRSFNAGNIGKGQEDAVKAKARRKLGK